MAFRAQADANMSSTAATPVKGALSYEDIASSKPFRFSVGPQKREFTIHSALISGQSSALDRLVNGNYKEAQDYHAELESVEEETFIRFVHYAYTGQYSDPELGNHDHGKLDGDAMELDVFDCSFLPKKGKKYKKIKRTLISDEPAPAPESEPEPSFELNGVRKTNLWNRFRATLSSLHVSAEEPYHVTAIQQTPEAPFLSHARVFVFADYWGVTRLRQLSLQKLGKSLEEFELTSARVEHVVSLLEYCYDEPRPEELTSLLSLYAACKIDKLWKSGRFQGVFSRHGELARALVGAMVETA